LFSKELTSLIIDVITSWQTLAITLGIVVYIAIVNNVARLYRSNRPKSSRIKKPKKEKKAKKETEPVETVDMDDLGLED
jgi:hypothetical protein